jgi:hypothetical protein
MKYIDPAIEIQRPGVVLEKGMRSDVSVLCATGLGRFLERVERRGWLVLASRDPACWIEPWTLLQILTLVSYLISRSRHNDQDGPALARS